MRSRYSAYSKGLTGYLLRTWDPSTRPDRLDLEPDIRWTGLELLARTGGGEADETGTVEFSAHYRTGERSGVLHEISRFVRHEGGWAYLDGTS